MGHHVHGPDAEHGAIHVVAGEHFGHVVFFGLLVKKDGFPAVGLQILPRRHQEPRRPAGRVNVPADFDTIDKTFSGIKTAEKGIKQGISRSNADFEIPCLLYSAVDFYHSKARWHRGV